MIKWEFHFKGQEKIRSLSRYAPGRHHMDATAKLHNIIKSAVPFIMARRKETGGFGATRRLPATIQDTYHALQILMLVRQYAAPEKDGYDPASDENLGSYLLNCRLRLQVDARTRFQMLKCSRFLGQTMERDHVKDAVVVRLQTSRDPEEWYYHARTLREVLDADKPDVAVIKAPSEIMTGKWRTVREAWMHLYLADFLGYRLPMPEPELTAWFKASQNSDGGFGFFPRTTSFVENCHAALRALAFLKAEPRNPTLAFRFLAGCQTASGGFSRSSRAAPFLDTTWHALAALHILSLPAGENRMNDN